MAQVLDVLASVASIVSSVGTYLAPPAALIGLGFLNPRAGPMRALHLGFTSKWSVLRPAFTASQRTAECQALRTSISARAPGQYIVMCGPKVRT
jgi:hypothetical protein